MDTFTRNYQLSGQTLGTVVDFQISSWNVNGESQKSNVLNVYIATKPSAPEKPTETAITIINEA
jgi:hypothetical protein